ncbi:MAG: flagellar M-ring protein FliF [Verrucomicrobia bacterium]|nr:flagellar M-ring protein FliF [Verrucomicrobiota bacterium]
MHALKLIGQQLSKIWSQLGINQRVVIVLSGLAVLVGLGLLIFWTSRAEYKLVYGHLDPVEAGKIIAELEANSQPFKLGHGGSSIYVPQEKTAEVRAQLAMKGMPKVGGIGFEIFDKPSFGMSDFVQQANYTRALQGELERTINKFEGVESSRVFIVQPENRLLVDPNKKTTAAVHITARGTQTLDARTVGAIRSFVASAVEGLKVNNVSVVDSAGNSLTDTSEDGSLGSLSSTQLGALRSYEKYLMDKVKGFLERVVGPEQVVVAISAELSTESITKEVQTYEPGPEGKGIAKTETIRDETTDSVSPNPSGIPGTPTNSNTDTNNPAMPIMSNKKTMSDTQREYLVGINRSNITQIAGWLKRVSASVFVNTNENPSLMIETNLTNLKTAVLNALGLPADATEVALFGVSFNERKVKEIETEMDTSRQTEMIWRAGKSLLYALLGIAALIAFWRLVKNSSEELLPTGIPVGQLVGGQILYEAAVAQPGMALPSAVVQTASEGPLAQVGEIMPQDEDVEELQAAKSKLVMDFGLGQQAPERITIEVLKQLIRENPAKMSQAARSWMSRKANEGELT